MFIIICYIIIFFFWLKMLYNFIRTVAAATINSPPSRAWKKVKLLVVAACLMSNFDIDNPNNMALVVRADQPVHCLRGQLYGVWNFHVSKVEENVNLFDVDEVCTHKLPNKL